MIFKIVSIETARDLKKWIVFIILFQVFNLFIFNSEKLDNDILLTLAKINSFLGYLFFLLVPYFLVRKELVLNHKQSSYHGLLKGFIVSFIFATVLLIFSLLDLGLKVFLEQISSYSTFIVFGLIIGSIVEVIIGTFSGGIVQLVSNKKIKQGCIRPRTR